MFSSTKTIRCFDEATLFIEPNILFVDKSEWLRVQNSFFVNENILFVDEAIHALKRFGASRRVA